MAVLSRLSMVLGLVLTVAGLSIRGGVLGVFAGSAPSASAEPAPTPQALVATPAHAPPTPVPPTATPVGPSRAPQPTPTATPVSPAANPMTLVFEDTFDAEGAWPTGQLGDVEAAYVEAAYVDGLFLLAGPGSELPTFLAPVAEPLAPSSTVIVEASLALDEYGEAGVYVGTSDSERIGAVVSSDGRVSIIRDSSVTLDVIATGSAPARESVRLTLTLGDATASVAVDGRPVAAVALTTAAVDFGLMVWPSDASVARVAEFRVLASRS